MPERQLLKLGRLSIRWGSLKTNHHGPDFSTRRSTWARCRVGMDPARGTGLRVYRYGADGSNNNLDLIWYRHPVAADRGVSA